MEMETKKLENHINKCAMSNGADMGKIVFNDDGILLESVSIDKTSFFTGSISKDIMKDTKNLGEFCIRDLDAFGRYLHSLGEFVEIAIDNKNTIVFKSGNKEITSKIADKDLLDETQKMDLTFDYTGNVKSDALKDILKDTSIFGTGKSDSVIIMNITGDIMTLKTSNNDDSITHTIKLGTTSDKDITAKFTTNLLEKTIGNITTNFVTISMSSDYPMKVEEVYEKDMASCWIIAPYVE